jgi:hypothetical protein
LEPEVDLSRINVVFIDTEFTDFHKPQLISLGCVRLNERYELAERLYVEVEFDLLKATDWVCEYVVPKLDGYAVDSRQAARTLADWLKSLPHRESVICFDFQYDWDFVGVLLGPEHGDLIARLTPRYVREEAADTRALIPDVDANVHHALRDAEHLARGWLIHRELNLKDRHG